MMLAACPIMTANLARRQPRNRIDANSPLCGNALRRRYHLMMGKAAMKFPIANQVRCWPTLSWYGRACWQVASRMRHEENWTLIRQVQVFGFHFAALDVRQHSERHASALSELLHATGLLEDLYLA